MKEITKKVYVSDDGKEFNSEEDCLEHEAIANKRKEAFSKFKAIAPDIYRACVCSIDCRGCQFHIESPSTDGCLFKRNPDVYFRKIGLLD